MKKLFKSTKISLLFALLLAGSAMAAKPSAIVSSVSGNAFVMANGATKTLSKGDRISDFSDIVTEEGSQVTITDYYDHKYHLAGSGHVKITRNQIELARGYFWVQSFNQTDSFILKTANAKIDYTFGEAIVSFDPYSGKTQILSVKGEFEMANALETHLKVNVSDGQFSFVSNSYEKGIPRVPMQIGETSFKKITGLFGGIMPMTPDAIPTGYSAQRRGIASSPKKTKVIKVPVKRVKEVDVSDLYSKKIATAKKIKHKRLLQRKYTKKSGVIFKVYGMKSDFVGKLSTKKKAAKRVPASVPTPVEDRGSFESSLVKQYENQMRHDNEVNELIDELQNYDQDYKVSY